jgi:hypothetical protein
MRTTLDIDDDVLQAVKAEGRVKSRSLLDVNVLVALFDPDHVHHETPPVA